MIRRSAVVASVLLALLLAVPAAAFACGGLVAPGHAEVLQKATTLSAWHGGYEHYITGFRFAGAADRFGYIVPLPGVPAKIEKGGGWTLERLEREVNPVRFAEFDALAKAPAPAAVEVLQQVKIEALDITIVRGGGRDVAAWAARNGFDLTPDTPSVLGRYSSAGSVFALAKFDRVAADRKGLIEGQGQTIHFTIPAKAPWIPLNILALGKGRTEAVDADLFVLTDHRPAFGPDLAAMPGMEVKESKPASNELLSDLRSDKGMAWLPQSGMWFTALTLDTTAGSIGSDLSIDGGGPVHLSVPAVPARPRWATWATVLVIAAGIVVVGGLWRTPDPGPRPA